MYLIHPLTAFHSMANMDLGHRQNSSTVNIVTLSVIKRKKPGECTVKPGYNNIGSCDISHIASDIVVSINCLLLTTSSLVIIIQNIHSLIHTYMVFHFINPCKPIGLGYETCLPELTD